MQALHPGRWREIVGPYASRFFRQDGLFVSCCFCWLVSSSSTHNPGHFMLEVISCQQYLNVKFWQTRTYINVGKRLVECFNQKVAISYLNGYLVVVNDAFCKMILLIVYVHSYFIKELKYHFVRKKPVIRFFIRTRFLSDESR